MLTKLVFTKTDYVVESHESDKPVNVCGIKENQKKCNWFDKSVLIGTTRFLLNSSSKDDPTGQTRNKTVGMKLCENINGTVFNKVTSHVEGDKNEVDSKVKHKLLPYYFEKQNSFVVEGKGNKKQKDQNAKIFYFQLQGKTVPSFNRLGENHERQLNT